AGSEVVAGDFLQRQETVALAAVLDEGGFKRGLDAGDAALVDVGLFLFLGGLLDVDVVQVLAIDDGDAQFLCLRRVDQHALHCCVPYALSHAERRGVSPGSDLPPARERLATPVASSAAHHGGPRERLFHNAFFGPAAAQEHPLGGRPARRAGHVQRRCVHRAITGAAVQPLTWLPRGQWSRSGRTRGRPAFGRGTSSEIRTLSRPASVAEKNSGKTPREGRLP